MLKDKKIKKLLVSYKIIFALLGFSAIVTELAVTIERGSFSVANFFSYFTIQVNIIVFVTFLLSALVTMAGKHARWLDSLRTMTTVYILIVGIGFAALLSGLKNVELTAVPWDNVVLHYIIPLVALADFIIDRPNSKLTLKAGLPWLLYPIAYAVYSLIRGSITGWYPYPFLNPQTNGFGGIIVAALGLLVLGILLIQLTTWLTRRPATTRS